MRHADRTPPTLAELYATGTTRVRACCATCGAFLDTVNLSDSGLSVRIYDRRAGSRRGRLTTPGLYPLVRVDSKGREVEYIERRCACTPASHVVKKRLDRTDRLPVTFERGRPTLHI
jgi:hypothetical protein